METTSVALDREAYELLPQNRRAGESFSQTVKRRAGRRRPLASFSGAWKGVPERKFRELALERKKLRAADEERFTRLLRGSD